MPENGETVGLFCRLGTQWRTGPKGGVLGLDYPGVESLLRLLKVKNRADVFSGIQIMESAALPELNKPRK